MACIGGLRSFDAAPADLSRLVARMLGCQRHRDPEAGPVVHEGDGVALGMLNRPANVYRAAPDTPIAYRHVVAVIDGMVLDWPLVRERLAARDVFLEEPSCSQIVAAAYAAWGLDFMEHLEGEFACAVWDETSRRLVLARDPFGAKPLHYALWSGVLSFSSEAKGILAAGVPSRVALQSLSDFLSLNGIPGPATIFEHVRQVMPGTVLVVDSPTPVERRYFAYLYPPNEAVTEQEAKEELDALLAAAVRRRMVEEETYSFLSGGMDSSCVVSYAAQASATPVHSISVGFRDDALDELPYAKTMAQHAGTVHHEVTCEPEGFFSMLEKLIVHHDLPFYDSSAVPSYYAARTARQRTSLVLTGDGPDQFLGSGNHAFAIASGLFERRGVLQRAPVYPVLRSLLPHAPLPRLSLPTKVLRKALRATQQPVWQFYEAKSSFPEWVKASLCAPDLYRYHVESHPYRFPQRWFDEARDLDPLGRMLYADVVYYIPDDLAIKVDRMCRAHGLETLMPFYDRAVARFFLSLPSHLRLQRGPNGAVVGKYILRKIAEARMPASLLRRPKQGFAMPLDSWLRQGGGDPLRSILFDRRSLGRGYFRERAVRTFVEDFLAGRRDWYYADAEAVLMLLNIELWHRLYVDGGAAVPLAA